MELRSKGTQKNRKLRSKPLYGQMVINKGANTIQWGKDIVQQMVLRKLNIHIQKNKIEFLSFTIHKNQLKWIKGLAIRPGTVKLLEKFTLKCF